jgi:hypothetical protein
MCTAVASQADVNLSSSDMKAVGLVDGHAYSLMAAKVIRLEKGTERIVKIRNPWGQKEWEGDWADNSEKWTEQTKA